MPTITDEQLNTFLDDDSASLSSVVAATFPSLVLPVEIQDNMERNVWTSDRIDRTRRSLYSTIGVTNEIPPTDVEQQSALNFWWQKTGQFLPDHVVKELGIAGGVKSPTLQESMEMQNIQQLTAVKDHLVIERENKKDPLSGLVKIPEREDEVDDNDQAIKTTTPDEDRLAVIKETSIEDLQFIENVMASNLLDPDFDEGTLKAVQDEIKIKQAMQIMEDNIDDFPLIVLLGTDLFDTFFGRLPRTLSKDSDIAIRAASRFRERLAQQDPSLLKSIGLETGNIVATIAQFAVLPNPSKIKAFAGLSTKVKLALDVGTKSGLIDILRLSDTGETFSDRIISAGIQTGTGAFAGFIFGLVIEGAKKIAGPATKLLKTLKGKERQAALKAFGLKPDATDAEILSKSRDLAFTFHPDKNTEALGRTEAVKRFNEFIKSKEALITKSQVKGRFGGKKIVKTGKGFRAGFAEIEKPGKAIIKGVKVAAKGKEAVAIRAAEAALRLKTQPSKAVKPVKILTKKEAFSLQEIGTVGEGENIRIIADPKLKRSLQAKENEIAKLKTRRNELKAEKEFAVSKAKAKGASAKEIAVAKQIVKKEVALAEQIAKSESALAKTKEKAGVLLAQTKEQFDAKIDKINKATEFKQELRDDAISMIAAIPRELRPDFIKRVARIGEASQKPETSLKKVRQLAVEIQEGVEKFERRIETKGLADDIKKIEKDNRLGQVRLGKVPSPQRERLIETIDSIDLKKLSGEKEADLQSLQKFTQKLSSQLAGNIEALDADVEASLLLPNQRVKQLLRLSQKPIADVDVEDIKLARQSIASAIHEAKLKSQLLTKQGLRPVEDAIKIITTKEISTTKAAAKREGKPVKSKKGVIQKTVDFGKRVLMLDDAHLDTLVELSTGTNKEIMTQIFDTDLHTGQRGRAEHLTTWLDASTERFEEIGFGSLREIGEEVTVTLAGKKVTLSIDHLVKLELHARSPRNLTAILRTKGWAIDDVKIDYTEDVDRLGEINEALKIVRESDAFKGIADWTGELNPARAEVINEATLAISGYPIARDPAYTSLPRDLPQRVEGGKNDISVPPEQQGQYLPFTGGNQRIRLDRWSDDFVHGLESDAFLGGMGKPLRNARIVISSAKFQDSMREKGREIELQNMITILRRIQGVSTSRSTLEVFGGELQRRFVASALGARLSTIGTQAMSYPAMFGGDLIPFRHQRPLTLISKAYIAEMEKFSAPLKLRWKGRRIGVEVGTSASFEAFDVLLFDKSSKLSNKALQLLVFGDKQAIGNGHKHGVVGEILSTPRNGKNIDVLEWDGRNVADLPAMTDTLDGPGGFPVNENVAIAASRRIEFVTRQSQPMFDMLDRSVSLSNPNVVERALFPFRTALESQENRLMRAVNEYGDSPKKAKDKRKMLGVFTAVTLAAFSVAVWKRGLKWAIRTGEERILAAFGIFSFDDQKARQDIVDDVAKDTGKNLVRLTKVGKFAVDIGERVAESLSGDGYNWNRNSFDVPFLDVLQTGVDASVAIGTNVVKAGRLDEFVEEITDEDTKFNEQLEDAIVKDARKAIGSTFNFGVRIAGQPFLAPYQEFVAPLLRDSQIKIIREVTFSDVENPRKFANRVFDLFEQRNELRRKAKSKRLTSAEQNALDTLERFVNDANNLADTVMQIESPEERAEQFELFDTNLIYTEQEVKEQ